MLLGIGTAAAQDACPADFQGQGAPVTCLCSAQQAGVGTVWGTGLYTTDSGICRAAVHAGVMRPEGGGITVTPAPGMPAYIGSTANGVESANYGPWSNSFTLAAGASKPTKAGAPAACPMNFERQAAALTCSCAASEMGAVPVWGTGVYTTDSSVCRAAVHAGIIPPAGGTVNVVPAPGLPSYQGSVANGVQTSPYGPWTASFTFRQ